MDKVTVIASMMGGAALTAGGAGVVSTMDGEDGAPKYAEVQSVEPITETVRTPRQHCYDEVVTHQAPTKDPNRIAGTAIGAVIGGLVGNQVGGGNGKKVATAAGAVAGGYAGNHVQGQMQANNTVASTQQRCETVYDERSNVVGYKVTYSYEGESGSLTMDDKPGDRLLVVNGEVQAESESS